MRRIVLAFLLMAFAGMATAQNNAPAVGVTPPPVHYSITFASQHGEAFNVYIDGNLQNRLALSRVLVNEVSDQTHEVVVVLKRPVEKAAVLQLRPNEKMVTVNVNYDSRLEQLYLYTAARNRADADEKKALREEAQRLTQRAALEMAPAPESAAPEPVKVLLVSDEGLDSMLVQMRAKSFDNDRLALGKVLVASAHLTSLQIARLAETIDFSNSQVDFLKYAYGYCLDPANYYRTVDVLTFSADKRKVLDYIATQR